MLRTACLVPEVSLDTSSSTVTFSGATEAVNFASWVLPQIDTTAGDDAVHKYSLPSGEVGRVIFVPGAATPQSLQELITILRTVADVGKIFVIPSNHAYVMRAPQWQIDFAAWILESLHREQREGTDVNPLAFTVGGPDYRGMGHGARLYFLTAMTSPLQMQELQTVLRSVGSMSKIFPYLLTHALVFRAAEPDLVWSEWVIRHLEAPAALDTATYTAEIGDDVTRIFSFGKVSPQSLQTAFTAIRSELKITKSFFTSAPARVVVRGSTNQISAVTQWMASHSSLFE